MVRIVAPETVKPFPDKEVGIVEQEIGPDVAGRVHCCATSWPAQLYSEHSHVVLAPDDKVIIVGRIGITLLVKPMATPTEWWEAL